ncbi:MAG TPA: hypothetical protein VMT99_00480 [Candidatus Paceibacterota bacterium]|nr:hypothetical protein [Candidatus Paceibacterota bacterium]
MDSNERIEKLREALFVELRNFFNSNPQALQALVEEGCEVHLNEELLVRSIMILQPPRRSPAKKIAGSARKLHLVSCR